MNEQRQSSSSAATCRGHNSISTNTTNNNSNKATACGHLLVNMPIAAVAEILRLIVHFWAQWTKIKNILLENDVALFTYTQMRKQHIERVQGLTLAIQCIHKCGTGVLYLQIVYLCHLNVLLTNKQILINIWNCFICRNAILLTSNFKWRKSRSHMKLAAVTIAIDILIDAVC